MGQGLATWAEVVHHAELNIQDRYHDRILELLNRLPPLGSGGPPSESDFSESAYVKRLLRACPCLYSQVKTKVTPRAVVHLCEITLNAPIKSDNVYQAFKIQHPSQNGATYLYPPAVSGAAGGDIMEQLCSEVLTNEGVPHMASNVDGWPEWKSCSHLSLNEGKMTPLKLYGDILIPSAPHNLMISVKSEAARERFVVSGNRLESIGFGFFNDASEFWTENRMNLLKRWGFVAVYMPRETLDSLKSELRSRGTLNQAININGKPLYRPLEQFGADIKRVAGKLSIAL